MKILKMLILPIVCGLLAIAAPVYAEDSAAATNMQILLDKVKADKKLLVAANMDLNDTESKAFWPIYDAYQKDLQKLNDRILKMISSYAEAYNSGDMTDQQAQPLINEALAIEAAEVAMRKSFAEKLGKVLPAKKVARYLQIETKIRAAIHVELADRIPLVP
jgi:GTPase Era involved in 16S rRNA processing